MKAPSWFPSQWLLAQMTHLEGGALFVWGGALLFGWPWWWGLLACLAWATPKEFVFDVVIEKQPWQSNLTDWCFYLVGIAIATVALYLCKGV